MDAVLSGADNTENLNGGTLGAAGNGEGSAPVPGQDGNVEGMNEIGDDGVGGIQAPGNVTNALDDGYPVDNRDNADDSLQRIGATMGKTWFRVLLIAWLLGMAGFMGYHTFSTCVCVTVSADLTAVSDRWNRESARLTEDTCPSSWG